MAAGLTRMSMYCGDNVKKMEVEISHLGGGSKKETFV